MSLTVNEAAEQLRLLAEDGKGDLSLTTRTPCGQVFAVDSIKVGPAAFGQQVDIVNGERLAMLLVRAVRGARAEPR